MNQNKIIIYTDGGSRGNPGPGAVGIVIQNTSGEILKTYNKVIGEATNNEAEYEAILFGLQKIKSLFGGKKAKTLDLEFRTDSELVGKQLRGEYKLEEEKLFPFFIKIWNLKMNFHSIIFIIIPREENKKADRLVNEALDSRQKILDF